MSFQREPIVNVKCEYCKEPFSDYDRTHGLIRQVDGSDLCLKCVEKILKTWVLEYRERCAFPRDVTYGLAG